jgi:ABC-type multidrug transport system permease subunit
VDYNKFSVNKSKDAAVAVINLPSNTHAVNAARALVNGQLADVSILLGFGVVAALAALAMFWATHIFRQATA